MSYRVEKTQLLEHFPHTKNTTSSRPHIINTETGLNIMEAEEYYGKGISPMILKSKHQCYRIICAFVHLCTLGIGSHTSYNFKEDYIGILQQCETLAPSTQAGSGRIGALPLV